MTKEFFNNLSIEERYELLKAESEFISSKKYESYFVHLFLLRGKYVEMWRTISTNQIQWIELSENPDKLYDFVKDIKM